MGLQHHWGSVSALNFPILEFLFHGTSISIFLKAFAVLCLVAQSCPTLCDRMDCSLQGFSVHGDSLGKNTGVGCHVLLQGIFPTQGLNPGLPHCRWILYRLSYWGHGGLLFQIDQQNANWYTAQYLLDPGTRYLNLYQWIEGKNVHPITVTRKEGKTGNNNIHFYWEPSKCLMLYTLHL